MTQQQAIPQQSTAAPGRAAGATSDSSKAGLKPSWQLTKLHITAHHVSLVVLADFVLHFLSLSQVSFLSQGEVDGIPQLTQRETC
jgi:hypothetical protein